MIRTIARTAVIVTTMFAALVWTGSSADAATTKVAGTNAYEKLVLSNGTNAIVFKVYGPGGDCQIKYLDVSFRDKDGTRYAADAGCYPGGVWAASLTKGDELIDCSGYTMAYNVDKGFWKAVVPRSCLSDLADQVRVTESWLDDYSAFPGEAGPTKYVARG